MRIVVDANVALKWIVPEPDSDRARALIFHDLVVPDVFFPEIANVLWKKVTCKELTPSEADDAAAILLALPYDVVPSASLMRNALAMACRTGHPAYDFHYLALADRRGIPLVTADERFVKKVREVQPTPAWAGLVTSLADFVPAMEQ